MKTPFRVILNRIIIAILVCSLMLGIVYILLTRPSERELWRITDYYSVRDLKVVNNTLLFVGYKKDNSTECNCVYAVDKTNGNIIWSTEELVKPYIEKEKNDGVSSNQMPGIVDILSSSETSNIAYLMVNFETLFALNSLDGTVIWRRDFSGIYPYTLLDSFSNDLVFILDTQKNLAALDKNSGTVLWKSPIFIEPDQLVWLTYKDGVVYVEIQFESSEQFLAFDARTGRKMWETTTRLIFPFSAYSNNTLLSSNLDGWDSEYIYLTAYNLSTGQTIWEVPFEMLAQDLFETTVIEDQVYVVINKIRDNRYKESRLVALNKQTGKLIWQINEDYSHGIKSYLVNGGVVYAGADNGYVVALNSKTGGTIWQTKTATPPFYMLVESDSLILIDEEGYVSALNAGTGSQKWSQTFDAKELYYGLEEIIRVDNGVSYISSRKPMIYAVNIEDGKVLWSWNHNSFSPWRRGYNLGLVDNDIIYVVSDDGASIVFDSGLFALKVK